MYSCEICEIFQNTYFDEYLRKAAFAFKLLKKSSLHFACDLQKVLTQHLKTYYWPPVDVKLDKCLSTYIYKFFVGTCSFYLNEIFETASEQT